MSNVENLRAAHAAFNARDFDRAMQLVAPTTDFTDHGRGFHATTRATFRAWLDAFLTIASDIALRDCRYIDAGEWVVAQFRAVGTQGGPIGPFPASGKPFSLDVCELWRFDAHGEAIEGHNYSDGLGLLFQLGHLPAPDAG